MNSFYLFNEALNTGSIQKFEKGIELLNEAISQADLKTDSFYKDPDFWSYQTNHGHTYELASFVSPGIINLAYKVFEFFINDKQNIFTEQEFDIIYPLTCNGFKGFDFSATGVSLNRQITDYESFKAFKIGCSQREGIESVELFWANKSITFPNLAFCEKIFDEINKYSVNDDRFHLIHEKLTKLQQFAKEWKAGSFDHKMVPLDCSPDTPKRIRDTETLRTFMCEGIGNKIFSLHIKWSFKRQFFRMYFFPDPESKIVHIGFIGPKDDIGF